MPSFLLKLYNKSKPDRADHRELIEQVEIEAEDIGEAMAKVDGLRASRSTNINFGLLHAEDGRPYYPIDLRRRANK
jgi:hypothetical protein